MAKKYIHPVLHKMRVVLRDGRSVLMNSALSREVPVVTQVVSLLIRLHEISSKQKLRSPVKTWEN